MTTQDSRNELEPGELIERWIPQGRERRAVLRRLAESLEAAHSVTPNCWGLSLRPGEGVARLNVGMVNVLVLAESGVHFVLVERATLPAHPGLRVEKPRYRNARGAVGVHAGSEDLPKVFELVRDAHLAAIAQAGKRKSGYLWKQAHSPELVEYVSRVLGRPLPSPGYAPAPEASPRRLVAGSDDEELTAFEGELRTYFRKHRSRERSKRDEKIAQALRRDHGRLVCEVPGCGFDFAATYGELGRNYAQVHHLRSLASRDAPSETRLSDLAIVCANCHVMIHRGRECRELDVLIARRPRRLAVK